MTNESFRPTDLMFQLQLSSALILKKTISAFWCLKIFADDIFKLTGMDVLESSQVSRFYAGKNIFLTGGTGFLGKCFIEKVIVLSSI